MIDQVKDLPHFSELLPLSGHDTLNKDGLAWVHRPVRLLATVLAALTLLSVAPSALAGSLTPDPGQQDTLRGGRADCSASPRIRVVFNPDSVHAEIVLLLRKLEMTVQSGPSATGEFWLMIPPARSLEEARAMLRSSVLVEEAVFSTCPRSDVAGAK